MRPPDRAGLSFIGGQGKLVNGAAMRSPEFHRDVADAIVSVWRLRQQAFGYDVDPDESPVGEHVAMRVPRAGEPGLITWAPSPDGSRPRLSTVAEMTASIARCYDFLVPRADIAEYDAAPTEHIVLWVVAVGDLGGVARHVLDATRAGIPGWRIFVLCPEGPLAERLRAQGAAVLTAPISPADSLADGLSAVRHAVRTLRPAVVHSHLAYSDFLVAGATTGLPPKLVSTEHGIAGNDLVYHGTRWKSRVMELAHSARLRRFDALIPVSQATLDAVRRKWHPPRGLRTVVIPNGVDAPATLPDPVAGRFHVISLSRLAPEKGLFDLLEAFKLVYDEQPEARLTMAGEGPLGSQLEQRVAELGLDQVVAMPGYVEAQKLLAEGDVLVQLSTWENCSYTLLDAPNQGLAVVTTSTSHHHMYAASDAPARSSRLTRATPAVVTRTPETVTTLPPRTSGHVKKLPSVSGDVTVLMPAFNAERFLASAVRSVLNQTYGNLRLIVVNDGSTDGTHALIESFKDPRITVVTNALNMGISASLNRAIELVNTQYIARMDADDIAHSDLIEKRVSYLRSHPNVDIVSGALTIIDEDGLPSGEILTFPEHDAQIKFDLLTHTSISHPGLVAKRECFVENPYESTFDGAEDYRLWTRMALNGVVFASQDSADLMYRRHSQQSTSTIHLDAIAVKVDRARLDYIRGIWPKASPAALSWLEGWLAWRASERTRDSALSPLNIERSLFATEWIESHRQSVIDHQAVRAAREQVLRQDLIAWGGEVSIASLARIVGEMPPRALITASARALRRCRWRAPRSSKLDELPRYNSAEMPLRGNHLGAIQGEPGNPH